MVVSAGVQILRLNDTPNMVMIGLFLVLAYVVSILVLERRRSSKLASVNQVPKAAEKNFYLENSSAMGAHFLKVIQSIFMSHIKVSAQFKRKWQRCRESRWRCCSFLYKAYI